MQNLDSIRKDIDEIDRQIVSLYEQRLDLTDRVAEFKIKNALPVLDREREQQKLEALCSLAESDFSQKGIRELFEQIMAMSRKRQYQLLTMHGLGTRLGFSEEKKPNFPEIFSSAAGREAPLHVVYQGAEGAYSQEAMARYFGEDCIGSPVATWKDAMEEIADGRADFAVLPIENSSAGIVSENYDLLVEYNNHIVGEQIIKVEHALLGLPGASEEEITCVISHQQALLQCRDYLKAHPKMEQLRVGNTALAAAKVKADGDPREAAIAGEQNRRIYGLSVLRPNICDNRENFTRFIIVCRRPIYYDTSRHISLCFEIAHESGSLYRTLSHFIYNGLNMVGIQSRPIRDHAWEYRFFVDLQGSLSDTAVHNALQGLREETAALRILGTY